MRVGLVTALKALLLRLSGDRGTADHGAANHGAANHGASDHGVSEAVYLADPDGNLFCVVDKRPR